MPGVQEKYTIDVTNRFGVTSDAEDEEIENVDPFELINDLNQKAVEAKNAPKPKVQKKKAAPATPAAAPAAVEQKDDNRRGGNRGARRGGRGSDRPRGPPRTQNGENTDGAPQREGGDRPRGGGRGRGRGGRRDGDRKFDRKSGDPKSSYKGSDKREGAGAGNWGTTEDDLKAQTEPTEEKPAVDGAAAATEEEKAPPAPVEPEEKTLTLEEYRAQQKKSNRNPNAKVQEDKEAASNVQVERTKKGRAARVKEVDFKPAPISSRRGDNRGGRGGGRGRGGNRGSGDRPRNNEPKKTTADFNLESDFPTLG
jgi:plasminogen activator inhibitor 1 RNA-binding protein